MKINVKIYLASCMLIIVCLSVSAQNNLKIKDVFDLYGKQEGSTLVQLSTDVLSRGSDITYYKSLITDYTQQKSDYILDALRFDSEEMSKISEVKKDGVIESGTYCLKKKKSTDDYEYILYRNKSKTITIVYLKGDFPPQQLNNELKALKDLFIYVNDKRIKLQ